MPPIIPILSPACCVWTTPARCPCLLRRFQACHISAAARTSVSVHNLPYGRASCTSLHNRASVLQPCPRVHRRLERHSSRARLHVGPRRVDEELVTLWWWILDTCPMRRFPSTLKWCQT
eukprot:4932763-Amphidinium_carterae.1